MADDPLEELRVAQARGAIRALKVIGEDLDGAAVALAPVEEGTLRASSEVAFLVNGHRFEGAGAYARAEAVAVGLAKAGRLRTMSVEVSANTIYAARQHEELDWQHPLGGQAKYLEQPFAERAPRYPGIIEASIRRAS